MKDNRYIKILFGFLGVAGLAAWINLAPLTGLFNKVQNNNFFARHPYLLWTVWTLVAVLLFGCYEVYSRRKTHPIDLPGDPRLKLLTSLHTRYGNRLTKKMASELNFQVKIKLQYTEEGTAPHFIRDHYIPDRQPKDIELTNEWFIEFEKDIGRLLILGDPGSGKTVLLLRFALHFIEKAIQDTHFPLPFILNLASWRKTYTSFENWLEEHLVQSGGGLGISRKDANGILSENNLFLLLDGLDEIPEGHRESCLECLLVYLKGNRDNKPGWSGYPRLIICSRKTEYVATHENAYVRATIFVMPLERESLLSSLRGMPDELVRPLLNRLEDFPEVTTDLRTAFNVHLALHLAEKYRFDEYEAGSLLLEYCLSELKTIRGYSIAKKSRYLAYLAYILGQTKKVITFELTDIQPFWAEVHRIEPFFLSGRAKWFNKKWSYYLVLESFRTLLFFILFSGLIFLICMQDHSMSTGLKLTIAPAMAILIAVPLGLLFTMANRIFSGKDIRVKEIRQFSPSGFSFRKFWESFKKNGVRSFSFIFVGTLLIGIFTGISQSNISGVEGGFAGGFKRALSYSWAHKSDGDEMKVLPVWVSYVVTLIIIILSGLVTFRSRDKNTQKIKPTGSERFDRMNRLASLLLQSSILSLIWYAVFIYGSGFIYGFYLGPFDVFLGILFNAIFLGLVLGMAFGGLSGIYNGFVDSCFADRRNILIFRPYKRFFRSILSDYLKYSVPLTALFLLLPLISSMKKSTMLRFDASTFLLIIGLIQGISFFIAVYNSSLVKHFAVRWILFIQGKAPLRYSHFLKEVAGTGLMEQDGGEWRFRHQLVQDLFAEL